MITNSYWDIAKSVFDISFEYKTVAACCKNPAENCLEGCIFQCSILLVDIIIDRVETGK